MTYVLYKFARLSSTSWNFSLARKKNSEWYPTHCFQYPTTPRVKNNIFFIFPMPSYFSIQFK